MGKYIPRKMTVNWKMPKTLKNLGKLLSLLSVKVYILHTCKWNHKVQHFNLFKPVTKKFAILRSQLNSLPLTLPTPTTHPPKTKAL